MDESTKKHFHEKLLEEQKRLTETMKGVSHDEKGEHAIGKHEANFPNYGDDKATSPDDNSPTEVADFQTNLSVTGDLEEELNKIEHALKRLEEGSYGTCEKCGKEIPVERLEAYPAATTCTTCTA